MNFFKKIYAMMVVVVSLSGSLMSSAGQEERFNQPALRPVSKWAEQVVAQFADECAQKNYYFSKSVAEQVAALVDAACVFAKVDKQKRPGQVAASFKNVYINIADVIQENALRCSKVCSHADYQKAFVESVVLVPDDMLKTLIRSKGNFAGAPDLETIYAIKQRMYQMVETSFVDQIWQPRIVSKTRELDGTVALALATFVHEKGNRQEPAEQLLKDQDPGKAVGVSREKSLVDQIAKQEIQVACKESGRIFSEALCDEITTAMQLVLVAPENDSEKLMRQEYIFNYYKHVQQSVVDYANKHELIVLPGAYYEYELKFVNSLKQANLESIALMFQGKNIKRGNDQIDSVLNDLTMRVMHKIIALDKQAQHSDQGVQEAQPAHSETPSAVKSGPNSAGEEELFDSKAKKIYRNAKGILDKIQKNAEMQGAEVTEKSWKMVVAGMIEAYKGVDIDAIPDYTDRFAAAVCRVNTEVSCLIKKYKKDFLSLGVDLSDYEEMFDVNLCAASKDDLVKIKGVKAGYVSDDGLGAFLKQLESAVLENLKEARTQKRALQKEYNNSLAQRVSKKENGGHALAAESVNNSELENAKFVSRQVQKKQTDRVGSEVKITSVAPQKNNKKPIVGIEKKTQAALVNVVEKNAPAALAKKNQTLDQESKKVTTAASALTKRQQVALLKKAQKEEALVVVNQKEQEGVAIAMVDGPVEAGVLSRREMRKLRSLAKLQEPHLKDEQDRFAGRSSDDVSQVSSAVATEVQQAVADVVASLSISTQTEVDHADQVYSPVASAPAASSSPTASSVVINMDWFFGTAYEQKPDQAKAVKYQYNPYSPKKPFEVKWIDRVDSTLAASGQAEHDDVPGLSRGQAESDEALEQLVELEQTKPRLMVRGRGIVGGSR